LKVKVLGSAAGGGFPQWNCNCKNCHGLRSGQLKATARTQSSIAISVDEEKWILFNASPDLRAQLEASPSLQPKRGLRDTGVHAIVLADSQIDHTTGLLLLREGCPLRVYCTDMVAEDLSVGFPIFTMLASWDGGVDHHPIPLDGSTFSVKGVDGIRLTAVPLEGKAPPYSPHRHDPHLGDNVGFIIEDVNAGTSVFYAPGLGEMSERLLDVMRGVDCVMVDGTFWQQDEMLVAGVGSKLASDMGHLPQTGENGMIDWLSRLSGPRKVLIHINNTNPILIEDSPQRAILTAEGIEVAWDGMEVEPCANQAVTGALSSRDGDPAPA